MSMYNERVFNILLESSNTGKKNSKVANDECGEECADFQSTIGRIGDSIVPDSVKMNKDSIPIVKVECGKGCKKECGDNECGDNECGDNECCKEEYFVDARVLDIYMEDNDIEDAGEALLGLCEYYGIDKDDMYLVIECDEVNKGLIKHSKEYIDCGLLRRCHDQIRNTINAGIKVVKRS